MTPLINQWEKLVFDFTGIIGEPSSAGIDQLIVFPDFIARAADREIFFDNIVFGDSSLSVNDNTLSSLKMYPNPSTDVVTFKGLNPINSITIYSQLGQKVLHVNPQEITTTVDVSGLTSGIYMVTIMISTHHLHC